MTRRDLHPSGAHDDRADGAAHRDRPRLGVLAYGPIQYHTPLYQRLADRDNVELDVLFLSDMGYHLKVDPGFGVPVAWDIDLLSGYVHRFLTTAEQPSSVSQRAWQLATWIPSHDAIVVNGYSSPWMLLAMIICRSRGIPFLLRASSHPEGQSAGMRRLLRRLGARAVVSASAGGLSMGQLNDEFYRRHGARHIMFAPNSVDNERFASPPRIGRSDSASPMGTEGRRARDLVLWETDSPQAPARPSRGGQAPAARGFYPLCR